jgi:DNA-directed RNA polymerase subunit RPC12/RpoP
LTYIPKRYIVRMMPKVELMGYRCERCSHEWLPRDRSDDAPEPRVCPKCKSPYWDKPRKAKKSDGA